MEDCQEDFTLEGLKRYLQISFGSIDNAAIIAEKSVPGSRVRQILTGHYLPKRVSTIYQYSRIWKIDPVVLAITFTKIKNHSKPEHSPIPSTQGDNQNGSDNIEKPKLK